ncbi:MAG: hypothetical protein AVDCRST_MAG08-1844 [uncultured Acetobacteraceae bacterium]|jgi:hypothetical protein|uniref:Uncharacterized protein n=1 Tax=uncultured Acetobacteraceae bacterium TaxID=169975 RepID=A0A6J4IB87_9PROT|nr:MAG: hypothetical protein AVDCRST_MAG08-1844 [uncultured Acetobacteraceae bacterium]
MAPPPWGGMARLVPALLLFISGAAAQTRNVGPGVLDRLEAARPRPNADLPVLGGAVQGRQGADVVGSRDRRVRFGVASAETLLATWIIVPYGRTFLAGADFLENLE